MRHVVKLKQAAEHTGLTEWELRRGAKAGRYPHLRAGGATGTILFDLELLERSIERLMMDSVAASGSQYGTIRAVK